MATLIKERHLMEWLTVSEVQSIIMEGHGSMQADMVLERELRVLHLTGNRKWSLSRWVWLEH